MKYEDEITSVVESVVQCTLQSARTIMKEASPAGLDGDELHRLKDCLSILKKANRILDPKAYDIHNTISASLPLSEMIKTLFANNKISDILKLANNAGVKDILKAMLFNTSSSASDSNVGYNNGNTNGNNMAVNMSAMPNNITR